MNVNKQLFKEILTSTILSKHSNKMANLEHFHYMRNVGLDKNIPIEEYGIKWKGGTITLRRYINESNIEVFGNIGGVFDSIEINYFDISTADFITPYKQLITEMIRGLETAYTPIENKL